MDMSFNMDESTILEESPSKIDMDTTNQDSFGEDSDDVPEKQRSNT